jgi:hypothetical protein
MKRKLFIAATLLVAALCIQSCSGNKTKKVREEEQRKPAPAAGKQWRGGVGTAANQASAPAHIPVKQRTPAALLAALPCKMNGKKGVFAVFPDNTAAGQICFGLYFQQGNALNIRKFDIQSGGMHIIFHDVAGIKPGAMKLMKWEDRAGQPCLEAACGKEIPVKRETYSAPGDSGWTYVIVTPEKPIDFASVRGAYYCLVIGADKYLPLFY